MNPIMENNNELDLGPIPELQRHWIEGMEEEEEDELIADRSYKDFQKYYSPNDFVMPLPCSKCYRISCYEDCCEEQDNINLLPRRLDFGLEDEDDFDLPQQPETLRRMITNAHLPEDPPEIAPEEYGNTNY